MKYFWIALSNAVQGPHPRLHKGGELLLGSHSPPLPASLNRRAPAGGAVYDLWIVAAAVAGIAAYLLMRRYQEGA